MKTKLFTALLILTTIPFFAQDCFNKAPIQQPTTVELLTGLKTLKIKLQNILRSLSKKSKMFKQAYGNKIYKETVNICHELYTVIPKEEIPTPEDYYLSCNFTYEDLEDIDSTEEILEYNLMRRCVFTMILTSYDEFEPNQEQLIKYIFIKYGKDASKPFSDLLNDFFCIKENQGISMIIDMTRHINSFLLQINTKIAELACPSEALAE